MGLHLNFELRLPASTSIDRVNAILEQLRVFALTLPFENVSAFLSPELDAHVDSERRLLQRWAETIATPNDVCTLVGEPNSVRGFVVWPRERCEPAVFALLPRSDAVGVPAEWFWHCCCKTQYASIVSDEHFLACHLSLVRVLERAIELGLDVVVRDETHYWETRNEAQLLSEVHAINQIVARIAGLFSDKVANEHEVIAPIFEHPRFEHLETSEEKRCKGATPQMRQHETFIFSNFT